MTPDWSLFLTILLAVVVAELLMKKVVGPVFTHTPTESTPSMSVAPQTAADFVKTHFPTALTV